MVNIQTWLQDYADGRLIAPGAHAQSIAQYAGVEEYNELAFPKEALVQELHRCADILQKLSRCRTIFFIYGPLNIALSVRFRMVEAITGPDKPNMASLRIRLMDGETEVFHLISHPKVEMIHSSIEGETIYYTHSFGWNPQWLKEKGYRPAVEVGDGLLEEHLKAYSDDLESLFYKLGYVHPTFHFPNKKEESVIPISDGIHIAELGDPLPIINLRIIHISEPDPLEFNRTARVELTIEGDVSKPTSVSLSDLWRDALQPEMLGSGSRDLSPDESFLLRIAKHYWAKNVIPGTWVMLSEMVQLSYDSRRVEFGSSFRRDDPRALEKNQLIGSVLDQLFNSDAKKPSRTLSGTHWAAAMRGDMTIRAVMAAKNSHGDENAQLIYVPKGEKPHRYGKLVMEMEISLVADRLAEKMMALLGVVSTVLGKTPAHVDLLNKIEDVVEGVYPNFNKRNPTQPAVNSYGKHPSTPP